MRTWGIVIVVLGVLILYLGISGKSEAAWLALSGWTPPTTPDNSTDTPPTTDTNQEMRGGTRA